MKKYNFLILSLLILSFASCSKDETPEVNFRNPTSYFVPADDDTSPTAQLRRQFYKDNGIYLLFNDTLQHNYQGTDINGDPVYFTELIDIGYNVGQTSVSSTTYKYTYLTDYTMQENGVEYTENYILNHLTGKMRPYSLFLCNQAVGLNESTGATLRPYAMSNQRCMVISLNYLIKQERTESQKQQLAQLILSSVIGQMAENNSSAFTKFFSYSAKYYDANYSDFGMEESLENAQSVGFLSKGSYGSFPGQTADLNVYVGQAIKMTEEQFNEKYAGYDICIAKFAEVKRVLSELGYVY